MLKGSVLTALNKLPHIKPDIVRTGESWEEWGMKDLTDNIHKWLKRNKTWGFPEPERSFTKREKRWFMQKANQKQNQNHLQKNPEKQFACFVKKVTGETLALSMKLSRNVRIILLNISFVSNVARKATWQTSAVVEVVINARPSITPVCAMIHL